MPKILRLVFSSGSGNSIFLSILPESFSLCGCRRFYAWSSRLGVGTQFSCQFCQSHFPCVDAEDSTLGLLVWEWELNFPVNSARSDQSRVKSLNPIGCHDHLSVTACIKPIQLVEKFQHCPLDLSLSSAVAVVPFSP